MEGQGQGAEHQAGDQGQPLAFFQLALLDEQQTVDHHRAGDEHFGGTEDAAQFKAVTGEVDHVRVGFVDDEEQEQRDEIDQLFHNGSQKQDVAA